MLCSNRQCSCFKKSCGFLAKSGKSQRVRIFYKAAIGQLTQARNEETALRILKSIVIISVAETDGLIEVTDRHFQSEIEKNISWVF